MSSACLRDILLPVVNFTTVMVMFPNVLRPVTNPDRSTRLEGWIPRNSHILA